MRGNTVRMRLALGVGEWRLSRRPLRRRRSAAPGSRDDHDVRRHRSIRLLRGRRAGDLGAAAIPNRRGLGRAAATSTSSTPVNSRVRKSERRAGGSRRSPARVTGWPSSGDGGPATSAALDPRWASPWTGRATSTSRRRGQPRAQGERGRDDHDARRHRRLWASPATAARRPRHCCLRRCGMAIDGEGSLYIAETTSQTVCAGSSPAARSRPSPARGKLWLLRRWRLCVRGASERVRGGGLGRPRAASTSPTWEQACAQGQPRRDDHDCGRQRASRGLAGDGGPASVSAARNQVGVALDGKANLYIAGGSQLACAQGEPGRNDNDGGRQRDLRLRRRRRSCDRRRG